MMLNEDYKDMLRALSDAKAEFLVVGAYALAAHGYPRYTMDIDIWVRPSPENAQAVWSALKIFGAPFHTLTLQDLQKGDTVFQIGVAPVRIDIITDATGLEFEDAMRNSVEVNMEGIPVRVLSVEDIIRNKKATGRAKDLVDVETLEAFTKRTPPRSQE